MPVSVTGAGAFTGATTINGLTMPTDAIAPGMVLITNQSFTSVSSVSFNNCFSSIYENYKIVARYVGSSDVGMSLRLRSNSVDDSSNNYTRQRIVASNTTISAIRDLGTVYYLTSLNSEENALTAEIFSPFQARNTTFITQSLYGNARADTFHTTGTHSVASSYDGVSMFPSGGTFTGSIRIYGYRNA